MNKILNANQWQSTDSVLSIIRIITGALVAYHGLEIFNNETMNTYFEWDVFKEPSKRILPYLGKAFELIGGILLSLGFLTRIGSVLIIGTMLFICFVVGGGKFWYQDQHSFLFVLLAAIYLWYGGGKWSLDKIFF